MEQLLFEFVEQNGSFLVFYGENGLQREHLHSLQVQMLRRNEINRLLPITFDETDLVIRLRYHINGLKMLSQVLQYRRLSMLEYYEILLRAVTLLDDSKLYMLDEERYVLHEDFIFTGEEITDIFFVYLPTQTYAPTGTVRERLKQLSTTLIAFVDGMQAEGFQAILQYFYTSHFMLSDFKALLHRLEAGADLEGHAADKKEHPVSGRFNLDSAESFGSQSELAEELSRKRTPDNANRIDPLLNALSINGEEKRSKKIKEKRKKAAPEKLDKLDKPDKPDKPGKPETQSAGIPPKIRSVAIAVAVLGAVLSLKTVFEEGPGGLISPYTAMLAVGLSVLLWGDRVMLQRKNRRTSGKPSKGGGPETEAKADAITDSKAGLKGDSAANPQREMRPGKLRAEEHMTGGSEDENEREREKKAYTERVIGPDVPTEHYYEVLHLYTEILGGSGDHNTERIGFDNEEEEREEEALSYLTIRRDNELERIAIYNDVFVIGSKEEVVDYCYEREGVSRTHLEISRKSSRYVARDLGSKNGTFLNDVKMAPYREYVLEEGDRLRIMKDEFQFYRTLTGPPLSTELPEAREREVSYDTVN